MSSFMISPEMPCCDRDERAYAVAVAPAPGDTLLFAGGRGESRPPSGSD